MQKITQRAITTTLLTDATSISELTERCRKEVSRYLHGKPYSEQFCINLLRSATVQNDERAWQALESCFCQVAWQWLDCHPMRKEIGFVKRDEEVVAQALAELRNSAVEQGKEFLTLAAALRYLLICLNAAIVDTARTSDRLLKVQWREQPATADAASIQEKLRQLLPAVREQRLAYLLFHCGLSPEEIVRLCPREFNDLQEISYLRSAIMQQLLPLADRF